MSMGGGAATLRDGRVAPKLDYDDRVIRDKRFKLWIGTDRQPEKLFDMIADPWEENNLLDSTEPDVVAARKKLEAVAATFPEKDGWPRYNDNPPQEWDRKESSTKTGKQKKKRDRKAKKNKTLPKTS
jgi:hypothetical protein